LTTKAAAVNTSSASTKAPAVNTTSATKSSTSSDRFKQWQAVLGLDVTTGAGKGDHDVYRDGMIPLGPLEVIRGRKVAEKKSNISGPTQVIHKQHVSYDESSRRYVGLPSEWKQALSVQFGLPISQSPAQEVHGYLNSIPTVLVQLKDIFLAREGLHEEGVFRVQPDADECSWVKNQLNHNQFNGECNVNVVANLIKVWFRDLPRKILADLQPVDIQNVTDRGGSVEHALTLIPEPNLSIYRWLMDLCLEVASNEPENKMSIKNLSIVFGPNLWDGRGHFKDDPHTEMKFMGKVAAFFAGCLEWRLTETAAQL
jgi:hypothetical protein